MTCDTFRRKAVDRIQIQAGTLAADGYGGQTRTWATLASAWAIASPGSGRESFDGGQPQSRVLYKFVIRYRSIFKDTATVGAYRIFFDDRYFNVQYVRPLGADMKTFGRQFQEFTAEENAKEA